MLRTSGDGRNDVPSKPFKKEEHDEIPSAIQVSAPHIYVCYNDFSSLFRRDFPGGIIMTYRVVARGFFVARGTNALKSRVYTRLWKNTVGKGRFILFSVECESKKRKTDGTIAPVDGFQHYARCYRVSVVSGAGRVSTHFQRVARGIRSSCSVWRGGAVVRGGQPKEDRDDGRRANRDWNTRLFIRSRLRRKDVNRVAVYCGKVKSVVQPKSISHLTCSARPVCGGLPRFRFGLRGKNRMAIVTRLTKTVFPDNEF